MVLLHSKKSMGLPDCWSCVGMMSIQSTAMTDWKVSLRVRREHKGETSAVNTIDC
jgi:hypothetical protein